MKIDTPCFSCFARQAEKILEKYEPSRLRRIELMKEIFASAKDFDSESLPLELSPFVYDFLSLNLNQEDLYFEEKQKTNEKALSLEPFLFETARKAENPLKTALKLSVIGNILDYTVDGVGNLDLKNFILKFLETPFVFDESEEFFSLLNQKKSLVFLTDNSGEVIFDRVFLSLLKEEIQGIQIIIGGKEKPILNDMTAGELKALGFETLGRVLSTGSSLPGNIEKRFSPDFLKFWNTDMPVMAKGQGNFEGLSISSRPVYFAFMAKCPFLAKTIGVPEKSLIFKTGLRCPCEG